jgi:hypothetical protein
VAAVVGFALAAPAAHAAVRDVGMGQPYPTIAAALSASSDGDVINVVDPVHNEADIYVSEAVTIQGQGAAATAVQAHPVFGMASARVFTVATDQTTGGTTMYAGGLGNAAHRRAAPRRPSWNTLLTWTTQ